MAWANLRLNVTNSGLESCSRVSSGRRDVSLPPDTTGLLSDEQKSLGHRYGLHGVVDQENEIVIEVHSEHSFIKFLVLCRLSVLVMIKLVKPLALIWYCCKLQRLENRLSK